MATFANGGVFDHKRYDRIVNGDMGDFILYVRKDMDSLGEKEAAMMKYGTPIWAVSNSAEVRKNDILREQKNGYISIYNEFIIRWDDHNKYAPSWMYFEMTKMVEVLMDELDFIMKTMYVAGAKVEKDLSNVIHFTARESSILPSWASDCEGDLRRHASVVMDDFTYHAFCKWFTKHQNLNAYFHGILKIFRKGRSLGVFDGPEVVLDENDSLEGYRQLQEKKLNEVRSSMGAVMAYANSRVNQYRDDRADLIVMLEEYNTKVKATAKSYDGIRHGKENFLDGMPETTPDTVSNLLAMTQFNRDYKPTHIEKMETPRQHYHVKKRKTDE
jgi:hypothetical protein